MRRILRFMLAVTMLSFFPITVTAGPTQGAQKEPDGFEMVPVGPNGKTPSGHSRFIVIPNEFQYCECGVRPFPVKLVCVCTIPKAGICVEYES